MIFMSLPLRPSEIANARLVHEASRHNFLALKRLVEPYDGSSPTQHHSPIKERGRTVDMIVFAFHAFGDGAPLHRDLARSDARFTSASPTTPSKRLLRRSGSCTSISARRTRSRPPARRCGYRLPKGCSAESFTQPSGALRHMAWCRWRRCSAAASHSFFRRGRSETGRALFVKLLLSQVARREAATSVARSTSCASWPASRG